LDHETCASIVSEMTCNQDASGLMVQ